MTTFKPTIIALCGAQGVGKDTVAHHLVQIYGFTRLAFADHIRIEVAENWYGNQTLMFSTLAKDTPSKYLQILFSKNQQFIRWYIESEHFKAEKLSGHHYPLLKHRTPRELLKLWSTWRKAVSGDDVFERQLIERLRDDIETNYVISDLRLDREHARLQRHAGYFQYYFESWEVTRPDKHYSNRDQYDMRLPDNMINIILHNNRDLTHLYSEVDRHMGLIATVPCAMS